MRAGVTIFELESWSSSQSQQNHPSVTEHNYYRSAEYQPLLLM